MGFLGNVFARKTTPASPQTAAPPLAARVEELFKAKNVEGLRSLVGSAGNAVTDILIKAVDENPDPQAKIMAIDSLGLTADPRAVAVLSRVFDTSSDFRHKVAALSLANIVANRVLAPDAIPTLMAISRETALDTLVRGQAVMALCRFRKSDPAVASFLEELKSDPNQAIEIKVAAI